MEIDRAEKPVAIVPGLWWHSVGEDRRIQCDLCPRTCVLKDGDRGFCFVRQNLNGQMVLSVYGLSTGFYVDPIEKKPLYHFFPGTSALSFGTLGCNLGCQFCQNWTVSKSSDIANLSEQASPERIAKVALRLACRSVAFTYNDPITWAEYAVDTAAACRQLGIKTVAVTNGYINAAPRADLFSMMDAANVDLKAFSERFYQRLTLSHLEPVLDTLRWLKHESNVWFEITNLLIPDENDSMSEVKQMCDWILSNLGDEVPVHFTAFQPSFRMKERQRTAFPTLVHAREQALAAGLKYVYLGNVHDERSAVTHCPHCQRRVIERSGHGHKHATIHLKGDCCPYCGTAIAGVFDKSRVNRGQK